MKCVANLLILLGIMAYILSGWLSQAVRDDEVQLIRSRDRQATLESDERLQELIRQRAGQ